LKLKITEKTQISLKGGEERYSHHYVESSKKLFFDNNKTFLHCAFFL